MHRLDARCARGQRGVGVSHSREIAGLWARSLTASTAVGGEAEACAYCEVALAGARCLSRRVSMGFGTANVTDRSSVPERPRQQPQDWLSSAVRRPHCCSVTDRCFVALRLWFRLHLHIRPSSVGARHPVGQTGSLSIKGMFMTGCSSDDLAPRWETAFYRNLRHFISKGLTSPERESDHVGNCPKFWR